MRAWVVHTAGGPSALELNEVPDPEPRDGWVAIDVKAFGLNRAEAITRAGGSGDAVPFPRIIGIECVGIVTDAGGTDLVAGQRVAAAMGGMGRSHDGSYAEKTLLPRSNVFPIETDLDWATFGAIPETFLTAWGCLRTAGALTGPERSPQERATAARILMRPAASALGLAVAQIVTAAGGEVVGVTRSGHKRATLLERGFTEVLVTSGPVADDVRRRWPDGATGAIDTVASDASLADDRALLGDGGRICLAGSLAESYGTAAVGSVPDAFRRNDVGFYSSETLDAAIETPILQAMVDRVADGTHAAGIDRVVGFGDLVEAHEAMEANAFAGKVVVDLSG
ncbi:MAG: zinc-binding dehydrogenase [Actinomycetota bacterium]